jgi:hypothetical protein
MSQKSLDDCCGATLAFSIKRFGLGLNYGFLDLHGREDDIQGELNSRVLGLVGYLKAYF